MKKKIKNILLITHNFWPENFPINTFIKVLSKNFIFTILTGKPNYPKGKIYKNYNWYGYNSEGFINKNKIYRSPIIPRGNGSNLMKVFNYCSFILFSLFYVPFLSKKKIDHIFIYAPSPVIHALIGILLKKILNVKMSIWIQDILTSALEIKNNNFMIWILNKILIYIYNESDVIYVQSKHYINYIKKITPKKKIVYLPNLINRSFKNDKLIKVKNFNPKNFNICYFGNLGNVQEFNTIINAAKLINNKNISFHLFGEGINKNYIKLKIDQKKIFNFYVHDYMNYSSLKNLIAKSSILYLSLKKNKKLNYTAPSKLQLYMYSGKPIIGEISGESKRLIKEAKCGLVVDHGNVRNMVKSIKFFFKIRKLNKFKIYGKNGKIFFNKNFSERKVSEIFINSLKNLK